MIEQGQCDFVDDIAVELPLRVIADMLGVPQDDRRQLFEWTNTLSRTAATADPQFGMGALLEIGGYMNGITELTSMPVTFTPGKREGARNV